MARLTVTIDTLKGEMMDYRDYREASIAVGGDGYLTKPFKGEELLREVRVIAARQGLCSGN